MAVDDSGVMSSLWPCVCVCGCVGAECTALLLAYTQRRYTTASISHMDAVHAGTCILRPSAVMPPSHAH